MFGHLQVLRTIFCEEISISSLVRVGRDLTLQRMGGIGLMSNVRCPGCSSWADQTGNRNLLTEYCTENLKMAIHKGRNM